MPNKIKNKLDLNDIIILKKFAYHEELAHRLAYQNLVDVGDTKELKLLNYNEQPETATVTRIPINNPSIVAYILSIESKEPYIPNKIQVIWRGTHDIGSAIADLDPISPGYQDYLENKVNILSAVNDAIKNLSKKNGKPISLGSYGHSLGGSLAQVFTVDVMDAIAQNYYKKSTHSAMNNEHKTKTLLSDFEKFSQKIPAKARDYFSNVKHINVGTFNAAGISSETADRANIFDQLIHNKKFMPEYQQPTVSYFAGLNHKDGVQQTGAATILANSNKSHVYLLKTNVYNNDYYDKMLKNSFWLGSMCLLATKTVVLSSNLVTSLIFSKMLYKTTKSAIGTVNVHTAKLFNQRNNGLLNLEYYLQDNIVDGVELFKNDNLTGKRKINNSLNKKSKLLQYPMLKFVQSKIHSMAKAVYNKTHNMFKN